MIAVAQMILQQRFIDCSLYNRFQGCEYVTGYQIRDTLRTKLNPRQVSDSLAAAVTSLLLNHPCRNISLWCGLSQPIFDPCGVWVLFPRGTAPKLLLRPPPFQATKSRLREYRSPVRVEPVLAIIGLSFDGLACYALAPHEAVTQSVPARDEGNETAIETLPAR